MPVPLSTYRVQLRPGFGFRDAAAIVPYLEQLGVSHLYCSPVLQAAPGSTHGYDVVDPSRLSADLGGEDGWAELVAATHRHGLGIVVDVVPNHMAASSDNPTWQELLATGRDGPAAAWFDVDWDSQDGRVLLPVLGEPRAEAPVTMAAGTVRYVEHAYPDSDHYRLAWWRLGVEELNYRRFFDITSMVAVRVEDPQVFTATHARLLRLVAAGEVDGFRIDHPDGLADPLGYLERLHAATGGTWVVVEKILEPGELLATDWPCAGTTGYDAMRRLGGVLLDPAGAEPLAALYAEVTGGPVDFDAVIAQSKADVLERVLPAEVSRLVRVAYRAGRRREVDLSERGLRAGLVALLGGFDVYRAYLRPGEPLSAQARERLDAATDRALASVPARAPEIRFLRDLAVSDAEFAVRFQQTCGPVMAKGLEDTAFYRWFRLSSLNEVGGSPALFGTSVAEFHRDNAALQRDWPASMTGLTTHDTKRSEDVRARLAVLSELPAEWGTAVRDWQARHRFGDPDLEYLCWQSLVGAWPVRADRVRAYLDKASREAKLRTSWTDPDPAYDAARDDFVQRIFADEALQDDLGSWVRAHLLAPGRSNVLSQKLLQLAVPGVPDMYQGTELESLSLVDPDNRGPVDYARRAALVRSCELVGDPAGGAGPPADGRVEGGWVEGIDRAKMRVVRGTLRLRRELPEVFQGGYGPVGADGPAATHLVGFHRGRPEAPGVVALATRLPVGLIRRGGWADTTLELPPGQWREVFTGSDHPPVTGTARVGDIFSALPVALFQRR